MTREAYSHEVSSAGFWPGGGPVSIRRSTPTRIRRPRGSRQPGRPAAASFSTALGEFLLPYDAVRTATSPDETLLEFLQSTYEAAANLANRLRGADSVHRCDGRARAAGEPPALPAGELDAALCLMAALPGARAARPQLSASPYSASFSSRTSASAIRRYPLAVGW